MASFASRPYQVTGPSEESNVAGFLALTERSVENFQREGLPFYRIGCRRNRYGLQAIREWLARRCRANRGVRRPPPPIRSDSPPEHRGGGP